MSELLALLNGHTAGVVRQSRTGDVSFTYEDAWRDRADAYPLSLSMPLTRREHADAAVRAYLDGLLPDNGTILERWATHFHVSARNSFALLQHMGEDCAGAVQFVRPERREALTDPDRSSVDWLTEEEVGARLRDLVEEHGRGRLAGDRGQFSLAGAQPKTALLYANGGWGIPSGSLPTTHILKPPAQRDLGAFDVNEHFCLKLARHLGLDVVESTVQTFDGQPTIVVARYDRHWLPDGTLQRKHQEDICQALGVPPWKKYEAEGGPGAPAIIRLLVEHADDPTADVGTFLDALVLNWAIVGTDAHAKNYSLLLQAGSVRLAPLYDLVSVVPYPRHVSLRKAKLSMRVGREYLAWKLGKRHWEDLADQSNLDRAPVLQRAGELLDAIPQAVAVVATEVRNEGLGHEIVARLEEELPKRAQACARALEQRAT